MNEIIKHFYELFTLSGFLVLINIIIIDIVMSGDNAIIIGMATRNLPEKLRKKAITIGIILATILRVFFAFFATILLSIVGIRLAGGFLLLYVVWKFYKELRLGGESDNHYNLNKNVKEIGFLSAVYTIIIADVSMSLDNVLAVAGAASENIVALGIGLIFSILLMAFASNFIAKNLNKYPIIQWIGLLVILFVAIEMILKGSYDIQNKFHLTNLLPILTIIVSFIFIFLHQKYITHSIEERVINYLQKKYLNVIVFFTLLLILVVNFGDVISLYIKSHDAYLYSINFILLLILLEVFNLFKIKKNK